MTSINVSAILDASTEIDSTGGHHVEGPTRTQRQRHRRSRRVLSKLFDTEPAKRRPGYANFAIADPPLKLILLEDHTARGRGSVGALNHLGVEVETTDEVTAAAGRLTEEGMATEIEEQTTCCYAVQDKVWVSDPDGAPWEVYTVLADAPAETGIAGDGSCCVPETVGSIPVTLGAAKTSSSCC